ncbi:Uroporphyrinogen III synthase/methyltransferase [uncultured delta proteobacterium]|uniref:uroporphyrinogen-III C-methyltransferase n=1 Tax=uncultured delta proteobacterium TaxID=34034 RepID=A0A212JZS6_9DELT|nr:Uroporphyrinogen III synthase/methyltransferase [uncultured delta proteobacterium]
MSQTKSTVYLIGAGPGDAGLLTLRGKELLETCDVIVYDYLASEELLAFARPDAEVIYVGKMGGDHTLPQQDINRLLVSKAREGKSVARLKGGDPYMFGRGAEEAEELLDAGVAFEVVPGVTSAIAGPAYAGIPLTHRAYASSVCFATGHEDPEKAESAHDWKALATGASTLVFFMGMKNLPSIVENLTKNGMDPATPAALVRWGTTPDHRSAAGTLGTLQRLAEEGNFTAPSLIVIGKVVALHDTLNWFEKKPLLGQGVLVTRSREQASGMAALLAAEGARVVQFPTITIAPPEAATAVRQSACRLRDFDWVVFTSPNGVAYFWRELEALGLDTRALGAAVVAAIGPATAEALAKKGVRADYVPASYVAEDLLEGLVAKGVAGKRILIPRAENARDVLPKGLMKAGAEVTVVPAYRTLPAPDRDKNAEAAKELFAAGKIRYITFASSSTVTNFLEAVPAETLRQYPDLRFACIGPVTAKTLEEAGLACHVMPEEYTIPALVAAITKDSRGG